jgi:hypothetical protein
VRRARRIFSLLAFGNGKQFARICQAKCLFRGDRRVLEFVERKNEQFIWNRTFEVTFMNKNEYRVYGSARLRFLCTTATL